MDIYSKVIFAGVYRVFEPNRNRLYTKENALCDLLQTKLIPFFQNLGIELQRVLTELECSSTVSGQPKPGFGGADWWKHMATISSQNDFKHLTIYSLPAQTFKILHYPLGYFRLFEEQYIQEGDKNDLPALQRKLDIFCETMNKKNALKNDKVCLGRTPMETLTPWKTKQEVN